MSPEPLHPVREELFAYRDGELAADRRVLIEAHVLTCRSCRERIDEISSIEAALRARPDSVGERYFERLTDAVMKRVEAEGTLAQVPLERRKTEAESAWEEKRARAPRLSWAVLLSIGSAAAAVLVVVVLLAREGMMVRSAPPAVVLERSAPDAAHVRAKSESTLVLGEPARDRVDRSAPAAAKTLATADGGTGAGKALPRKDAARVLEEGAARDEAADRAAALSRKPSALDQSKPEAAARAAPMAAAQAPTIAGSVESRESGLYPALIQRYGLPPVWGSGVSDQAILRAEPALRNLYRTGGAAQDSARVRLYLAEAARVRAGSSPDSAAIDEIARHYRRAIGLARDPATASVARSRLIDFLREVGLSP